MNIFYGLVSILITWNYFNISSKSGCMARKHLSFSSHYGYYDNLALTLVYTLFNAIYTISII